jgi:two-component system nitrate/nitrite response regulator NarL
MSRRRAMRSPQRSAGTSTSYPPKTLEPLSEPQPAPATIGHRTGISAISIVSNSQLLREGLTSLLMAHSRLHIIGSYSGRMPGAIPLPSPAGHVVLLDGNLGRNLGVAWTLYWHGMDPPAHVVLLELLEDIDLILSYIEAGAAGYTLQGASVADLVEAIDGVRQRVAHCSPEVTAGLFARLAALRSAVPPVGLAAQLTPRELEVLRYIAEDYSNQAIANALVIEVRTVKHHVHNILEKLNMRRRGDAARFAATQGWLAPDLAIALGER